MINKILHRIYENIIIVFLKFYRNLIDFGFIVTLKRSLLWIIKFVYQRQSLIIYEINLNRNRQKSEGNENSFTYRLINENEDNIIKQIEKISEWLKGKIHGMLGKGSICMVILKDDVVLGFNIASIGECYLPLIKLKVLIKSDEAWSDQISIVKEYRRKGLASKLRNNFYVELKNHGIKSLYGHRLELNIASKMSARRYTSKILGKAEYQKLFLHEKMRFIKYKEKNIYENGVPNINNMQEYKDKKFLKFKRKDKDYFVININDLKRDN
jgi:hypothetical protein